MVNRRQFLLVASLLSSSFLWGCNEQESDLKIAFLQGSLPLQLIGEMEKLTDRWGTVKLNSRSSLSELYDLLLISQGKEIEPESNDKLSFSFPKLWGNSPTKKDDLINIGNYHLQQAIKDNLIEPLQIDKLTHWTKLSPSFQKLVNRNEQGHLATDEQIWGAPFRWGCTMIAYRKDKFEALGWQPEDWQDLWNVDVQNRLSLLNQPREVIGLILKKLGYSYNSEDIEKVDELVVELEALHRQVRFYDSTDYLQPLILGDTWLALGWSTDILPIVDRYPNISAIVPQSGTALWADIWVKPKVMEDKSWELEQKIYQWMDFCWQAKSAKQINLFTQGSSTIEVSQNITTKKNFPMTIDIFNKSEFIEPMSIKSLQKYKNIWEKLVGLR